MLKLDVMFCIFSMVCWTVSPSSFKRSCWEVTCSVDLFHKFSFYFLSFKLPVLFYCAAYFFQLYHKTLLLKGKTLQRKISIKVKDSGEFSGSPLVETSSSNAGGLGSIPGQGVKIPHSSWPKKQNIKQKQYCNKFNKDFKNNPHQKKKKTKWPLKKKWRSGLGTILRAYGWWLFLFLSSLTWSPCCPFLYPRFPLASHLPSSFQEQMWTSSCGQPLGPCVQSGPWMRVSCCLDQRANWAIARWVVCWHGRGRQRR